MLTYCDVIDTRADRQQLWRHNDRLFRRGCYGRFLSTTHASDELCTCLVLNWSGVWQSDWQRAGIIICIFTNMGQPLPIAIVTSQWPIVPTGIYRRMILRSARVEGIAITLSCLVHDFITLHIVVEWFITAHSRVVFIHPNPSCKQNVGHVIHDRLALISPLWCSFTLSLCACNHFSCYLISMRPDDVHRCL